MSDDITFKFSYKDHQDIYKAREERENKEREDLERISKPLHELVVEARFRVQQVTSQCYSTEFTPSSESRIGGTSPVYSGGYTIQTNLDVISDDSQVPVKKLIFAGITSVRKGDNILARIPRYDKIRKFWMNDEDESYHVPREYRELEQAMEIGTFGPNTSIQTDEIVRTDRSAIYSKFSVPRSK